MSPNPNKNAEDVLIEALKIDVLLHTRTLSCLVTWLKLKI